MVRHLVTFAFVSLAAACVTMIGVPTTSANMPVVLLIGNARSTVDSADRALIFPVMGPQSAVKIKSSQHEPDSQPTPAYKPKHCRPHPKWRHSKARLHCGW